METYKVSARVGNAHYRAEGPTEIVKEGFDLFLGVISKIPGAIDGHPTTPQVNGPARRIAPVVDVEVEVPRNYHDQFEDGNGGSLDSSDVAPAVGAITAVKIAPVRPEILERAYRVDGAAISLSVLPQVKDPAAGAILLLVYGFHAIRDQREVGAIALTEAARQSGVSLARIDRTVNKMKLFIR